MLLSACGSSPADGDATVDASATDDAGSVALADAVATSDVTDGQPTSADAGGDSAAIGWPDGAAEADASPSPKSPRVSCGYDHSCAQLADGRLACWGSNSWGKLGIGDEAPSKLTQPMAIPGAKDVAQIALGFHHACMRRASGQVQCWGSNDQGQLGLGSTKLATSPQLVPLAAEPGTLHAGGHNSCWLATQGGAVSCWGDAQHDQVAPLDTCGFTPCISSPAPIAGLAGTVTVGVGFGFTCALDGGGIVRCWGKNDLGQLGNGGVQQSKAATPAPVKGMVGPATELWVGEHHACALVTGGKLYCWGWNLFGQLGAGRGLQDQANVPVVTAEHIDELPGVVQMVGGGAFTCVRNTTGEVWCLGYNKRGQLGNGSTQDSGSPVKVVGLGSAVQLAAGDRHACAVNTDDELYCWGDNIQGQVGAGIAYHTPVPLQVSLP